MGPPSKLLLLLSDDEPQKHAPMRFTPGGCCPCGVEQLHEIIMFGGTAGFALWSIYINDVLVVDAEESPDNEPWYVFIADFTPYVLRTTQPKEHYAQFDDGGAYHRDGALIDPALLVSGENTIRVIRFVFGIADGGTFRLCIGPVIRSQTNDYVYELDPNVGVEWFPPADITIPDSFTEFDETYTFNRP